MKNKKAAGALVTGREHRRLAYFAGTWAHTGEMRASPFGPAGKFAYTETCSWFEGGFALVCRSKGKTPEGTMRGLSIIGWDPGEKTYTYFEINSMGEVIFSRGTVRGDTWTWKSASKRFVNGKAVRGRLTVRRVTPNLATYEFQMGTANGPMRLIMKGEQRRLR